MSVVETEHVLVVSTELFRRLGYFQGFTSDVERYLDELFQVHSIKEISVLAKGLDDNSLKIGFTPELLAPLLTRRINSKVNELEQLAGI